MKPKLQRLDKPSGYSFYTDSVRLKRFFVPWHFHPQYEITYIERGFGIRIVGDSIQSFQEGDLALIGSGLPHVWRSDPLVTSARAFVVQFDKHCLGKDFFELPEMRKIKNLLQASQRGLLFTGKKQVPYLRERLQSIHFATGLDRILQFIELLQSLAKIKKPEVLASILYEPNSSRVLTSCFDEVYDYLLKHFRHEIKLDDVANIASMTRESFCRYFKKNSGYTLSHFINQLRVSQACQELSESDKSITQICFDCGYGTLSNFNKRFREIKQCSPREFRERIFRD